MYTWKNTYKRTSWKFNSKLKQCRIYINLNIYIYIYIDLNISIIIYIVYIPHSYNKNKWIAFKPTYNLGDSTPKKGLKRKHVTSKRSPIEPGSSSKWYPLISSITIRLQPSRRQKKIVSSLFLSTHRGGNGLSSKTVVLFVDPIKGFLGDWGGFLQGCGEKREEWPTLTHRGWLVVESGSVLPSM